MPQSQRTDTTFHHTHVATYFCAACALVCGLHDSAEVFFRQLHLTRKWFSLFGATCFFAYLYVRPLIRKGLGSAERGYVNFTTLYILWLVSAVFYHLPSLEALGLDIRADVSLLLMVFVMSLVTLGALLALHGLAVATKVLGPHLYNPGAAKRRVASMLFLNSSCLAVACSTYYGFCGNAAGSAGDASRLKRAVCTVWLQPMSTAQHPAFPWILYSEAAANSSSSSGATSSAATVMVDLPLDGMGPLPVPAGATISPVFTLWLTLLLMFAANCVADYAAAATMHAGNTALLRHNEIRLPGAASVAGGLASLTGQLAGNGGGGIGGLDSRFGRGPTRRGTRLGRHRRRRSAEAALGSRMRPFGRMQSAGDLDLDLGPWTSAGSGAGGGGPGSMGTRRRRSIEVMRRSATTLLLNTSSSVEGLLLGVHELKRQWSAIAAGLPAALHLPRAGPGESGTWDQPAKGCRAGLNSGIGSGYGFGWKQQPRGRSPMGGSPRGGSPRGGSPTSLSRSSSCGSIDSLFRGEGGGGGAEALEGSGGSVFGKLDRQWTRPEEDSDDGTLDGGRGGNPFVDEEHHSGGPRFLPMFPWYSGTSADLLKTALDLLVSVKLFLGRFDVRSMQASLLGSPGRSTLPRGGDGVLFEHKAGEQELWLDFAADTGDGGDPTYAVARMMAAPQLTVAVPAEMMERGGGGAGRCGGGGFSGGGGGEGPGKVGKAAANGAGPGANSDGQEGPPPPPVVVRELQRADVLVHGGDLAYPNPSSETYETRLFRPYEQAFPPPPGCHPAHLVVDKPDLPGVRGLPPEAAGAGAACGSCGVGCGPGPASGASPAAAASATAAAGGNGGRGCRGCAAIAVGRASQQQQRQAGRGGCEEEADAASSQGGGECRMCAKAEVLRRYDGPSCFVIPGNHDWHDGLDTYQRHVLSKGWLGGWLLPQEASYFALRLPHGWWLFGFDMALVEDIDMCQFRYFAAITDHLMGPEDSAILVTHGPRWLLDWYWGDRLAPNLRQLVRGHLKGRARMHLAGDLHFYMRHSFRHQQQQQGQQEQGQGQQQQAGEAAAAPAAPDSPESPGAGPGGFCASPVPPCRGADPRVLQALASAGVGAAGDVGEGSGAAPSGSAASPPQLITSSSSSSSSSGCGCIEEPPSSPRVTPASRQQQQQQQGERPSTPFYDASATALPGGDGAPLACNGGGVFGGVFGLGSNGLGSTAGEDGGAGAAASTPNVSDSSWRLNDPEHLVVCGTGGAFMHPTHVFSGAEFEPHNDPSAGPVYVRCDQDRGGSGAAAAAGRVAESPPTGGEYRCECSYPSPSKSYRLGRDNVGLFRLHNTRFDVIGGLLYYLLVVSVLPRCGSMAALLDATSLGEAISVFTAAMIDALAALFLESRLSLAVLTFLYVVLLCFARSGGIGCLTPHAPPTAGNLGFGRDGRPLHSSQVVKARMGGVWQQLAFALAHVAAHLLTAVGLALLLELGVETCIRYEQLGSQGYHSLYRWYRAFEATHFPDPRGLRPLLERATGRLYPGCVKALMALYDLPEALAVSRAAICSAGIASLTRVQALSYYLSVLAYYWLLATPAVGFLFGTYLYVCVNWWHVHFDEAFSSLRIPNYKGFCRLHVTADGDLEMFALGQDRVPCRWVEDQRWRGRKGGGGSTLQSHAVRYPSRWVPSGDGRGLQGGGYYQGHGEDDTCRLKVVDYLMVRRR